MRCLTGLSEELLKKMYWTMLEIREFESRAADLFKTGEMPGFLHSCLGQEAAVVGVCSNLRTDDYIVTTHRGHGHVIAKGTDVNRMMAELFARKSGCNKGKGGSMHIMDRSVNILGANGIVGQGITIGTGAAIANQIKGSDQVTVAFFGDGAQNEGFFHESLNMASIWKLPIVYACENNQFAESTSQHYHMNIENVADRAKSYGIEGIIADGNDIMDVYEKAKYAVEKCRRGEGPVLLESKTYRVMGHYIGDPADYRDKEVEALWKSPEKDAIARFEKALETDGIMTAEEMQKTKEAVTKKILDAIEFARNSEFLPDEAALEDVFKDELI